MLMAKVKSKVAEPKVVVEKKKPGEKKKVPESQVGKTVIVRLALGWPFFLF